MQCIQYLKPEGFVNHLSSPAAAFVASAEPAVAAAAVVAVIAAPSAFLPRVWGHAAWMQSL